MADRPQTVLAKQAVVSLLREGVGVQAAVRQAGYSYASYQKWRQVDEHFREEVDRVRLYKPATAQKSDELVPRDFQGFVTKYFPDRRPHLPHQLEIVEILKSLEPREVVLLLLWPEAGKSATLEDYMCRKLALDPDHRFRIISQTKEHAERMVAFCKRRFTDVEEWPGFIGRFGPFYEKNQERQGKPWGAQAITLLKATATERDRSIFATSWKGSTTGSRIDTAIFDDVQTPENYNQAEEIFRRIRNTFFTRGLEMRTLIIGHRIGPGDVYDRMLDAGLITKMIVLPAAGGRGAEPGMPTIPEWWDQHTLTHTGGACCGGLVPFRTCPKNGARLTPVEYMELMRHQVGEDTWHSMYMQDPVSDAMTTFGAYIDAALDHDRKIGELVDA